MDAMEKDLSGQCSGAPWFEDGAGVLVRRIYPVYLLVFAAVFYLACLYYREVRLRIPVVILPRWSVQLSRDIDLYWNPVRAKGGVAYDVQVSDGDARFKSVLHEWKSHRETRARKAGVLNPGHRYFWRVRSVVDGVPGKWSPACRFEVRDKAAEAFVLEKTDYY